MTQKRYGDEFNIGDIYTTPAITLTETHVVNWAGLTMDFYPLHMDKEYAARTSFGERLVHGPMIFGIAVGLASMAQIGGTAAIAWLGADKMRMLRPVKIGDTVRVEIEVLEKRETRKPEQGIQVWRYTTKNQRDEDVMVFDYTMMFHERPKQ
jgi:acyl dehydratase